MMQEPRFSVLVVEDDPVIRQYVMRALARENFRCDGAADGIEANAAMDRNTYDVVVSDLSMPNKNGHTLAVEILALHNPPALVILTGISESRIEEDLRRRGVDAIVHKPVNLELFAKCVHKLAARRQVMLTPHAQADSLSAINFLNLTWGATVENKNQRQYDFWHTPTASTSAKMTFADFNMAAKYPIDSSSNSVSLEALHTQEKFRESRNEPYQMHAFHGESGELHSPPAIKESWQDEAFFSIPGMTTPSVRNLLAPMAPLEVDSDVAQCALEEGHTLALESTSETMPETTPAATLESTPVTNQLSMQVSNLETNWPTVVRSLREELKLQGLESARPAQNFRTLAWALIGIVVLYLLAQFTFQISEVRRHEATITALKELGANVISIDDGTAIGMKDKKVAEMMTLLREVRSLRALVLSRSDVTDAQLGLLKDQNHLRTLDLDDTPVTDAGMDQLLDLKSLQALSLRGTAVTTAKLNDMQAQNPNLKINHHSQD